MSETEHQHETVMRLCAKALEAYGRPDLAREAQSLIALLRRPTRIVFCGEFKQGKSTLVNALAGHAVCPVDADVSTAVTTVVRSGPSRVLARTTSGTRILDGSADGIRALICAGPQDLLEIEVADPAVGLEADVCLVDTPGLGGLGSAEAVGAAELARASGAVVFVSGSVSELTAAELDFLGPLVAAGRPIIVALTKSDLTLAASRLASLDRGHLTRTFGANAPPVLVVSAHLHPAPDSGLAELRERLEVLHRQARREQHAAARETVAAMLGEVRRPLLDEAQSLRDSTQPQRADHRVELATQRHTVLAETGPKAVAATVDQVARCVVDADHDLRRRLRSLVRELDLYVDQSPPDADWESLVAHAKARTAAEVAAAVRSLLEGSSQARQTLADRLSWNGDEPPLTDVREPVDSLVERLPQVEPADPRVAASTGLRRGAGSAMTAAKGMQGGVTMLAVLAGVAGIGIAAPVLVGVGAVLGGKAVWNERGRRGTERRQQTKLALHRYLDDVSFEGGKQLRDLGQETVSALREECQARLHVAQEAAAAELRAALAARKALTDDATRQARLADVQAELCRLDRLSGEVDRAFGGHTGE